MNVFRLCKAFLCLCLTTTLTLPGAAALQCKLEDASSVIASGGTLLGEVTFEEGHQGKSAALRDGAALSWPIERHFDPGHGTLELWVCPDWKGKDGKRHAFFHLGDGDKHCTLFKTERNGVRFVYKASPTDFLCVDVPVEAWKSGKWHHLKASWTPCYGESMLILLTVDGEPHLRMGGKRMEGPPPSLFLGRRGGDFERADSLIDSFRLADEPEDIPFPLGPKPALDVTIQANRSAGELKRIRFRRIHDFVTPWNSKENPLPFTAGDPFFRRFTEADFKWVRLVAFSEHWLRGIGLSRDEEGQLAIDWTDFDGLLDLVKAAGAEPYIRLAYHTPSILVKGNKGNWNTAYAMPTDLDEWSNLMYAIVKHCNVDRGLHIKYWVASLNEADIPVSRGGCDWQTVCELYERTVKAALRADPNIQVGGPAMAHSTGPGKEAMFREFLRFCSKKALPLDFVCTHAYHRTHPREYEAHVNEVRSIVQEEWPDLNPLYFIDEFNQWARDRRADDSFGAAYMAAALHYQRRAGLDKSCVVSFNHFLPLKTSAKTVKSVSGPFDMEPGNPARYLARPLTCGGVERASILMHPPAGRDTYTFGDYVVHVPKEGNPRVEFFTGLPLDYRGMDGVTFKLLALFPDEKRLLFETWQRSRPWQKRVVSLNGLEGKTITLRWLVDSSPSWKNQADWAAVGVPRLVAEVKGKRTVFLDFASQISEVKSGWAQRDYTFHYDEETIGRYMGLPLIKGTVVTAPYFTYLMHSRMKPEALSVDLDGEGGIARDDATGVLASRDASSVTILCWQFDLMNDTPRGLRLRLTGMEEGSSWNLKRFLIDSTHTNPYFTYVIQGKASPDGLYNLESGELEIVEERVLTAQGNALQLDLRLPNMSVTFVELTR